MVVKTVVHFEIPASDVERLSKFYSDVFGWKFQKMPMGGGMDYWMITTGPQRTSVGGGMYKKQMDMETPRNYVAVDDIDAAIVSFTNAGGRQVVEKMEVPGFGWSYLGTDPEGNAVGLFQGPSRPPRRAKKAKARKGRERRASRSSDLARLRSRPRHHPRKGDRRGRMPGHRASTSERRPGSSYRQVISPG